MKLYKNRIPRSLGIPNESRLQGLGITAWSNPAAITTALAVSHHSMGHDRYKFHGGAVDERSSPVMDVAEAEILTSINPIKPDRKKK
jgi:hypothetical protein